MKKTISIMLRWLEFILSVLPVRLIMKWIPDGTVDILRRQIYPIAKSLSQTWSSKMKKYVIPLFLFILMSLFGCKEQGSVNESIKRMDGSRIAPRELELAITGIMEKAGVTGLSCAIINDSKIVYQQAFGYRDKSAGTLNDKETIFSGASFSKTVFAYLIMLLVEDGTIDLDKPLQEYLDQPLADFPDYTDLKGDRRAGQITARMVLSHTTGFPNWRFLTDDNKLKIMFEPGSRFSYSGEGFHLLQMVIEQRTGKDLDELSRERIFIPLNMMHTRYVWQESFENNFALPHDEYERPKTLKRRRKADSAGSLQTTAGDYARFLVAILNATGQRKATLDTMLSPQITIRSERMFGPGAWEETEANDSIGLAWGLGWGRFDTQYGSAFFHTGHDFGWQNYTVTFRDQGMGVVLMSNSNNFESVAREIAGITIGDSYSPFDWLGYPRFDPSRRREPPPERVAIDVDPDILKNYAGEYSFLGNRIFYVKLENGQLYGSDDNQTWVRMNAESETQFFIESEDVQFTFVANDSDQVTGFILHTEGIEIPGEKRN
ncbi:MAG: serine hydrolase [FCB group bacterium]|nr:serine hydrolase [FCB group bacterium]